MNYTGCRPFQEWEIEKILAAFSGKYQSRNRLIFIMGIYTGFRISEILSINVGDVWDGVRPLNSVCVAKGFMKAKQRSRTMPLHRNVRGGISELMATHPSSSMEAPLFVVQKTTKRLGRRQAAAILESTVVSAGVDPTRIATHSYRKFFANQMWKSPLVDHDIARLARLLGHVDPANTLRYLEFGDELDRAVLAA